MTDPGSTSSKPDTGRDSGRQADAADLFSAEVFGEDEHLLTLEGDATQLPGASEGDTLSELDDLLDELDEMAAPEPEDPERTVFAASDDAVSTAGHASAAAEETPPGEAEPASGFAAALAAAREGSPEPGSRKAPVESPLEAPGPGLDRGAAPVASPSGGLGLAGLVLGLLGLVSGGVAIWWSNGLVGRIDALDAELAALKSTPRPARAARPADPRFEGIEARLTSVEQRLDGLAGSGAETAAGLARLGDQTAVRMEALAKGVDALRSTLAGLRPARPAAPPVAPPAREARPQVVPVQGWTINLYAFSDEGRAEQERRRLAKLGVEVVKRPVQAKGRTWFRLSVTGYASRRAAQAAVPALRQKLRGSDPWVEQAGARPAG